VSRMSGWLCARLPNRTSCGLPALSRRISVVAIDLQRVWWHRSPCETPSFLPEHSEPRRGDLSDSSGCSGVHAAVAEGASNSPAIARGLGCDHGLFIASRGCSRVGQGDSTIPVLVWKNNCLMTPSLSADLLRKPEAMLSFWGEPFMARTAEKQMTRYVFWVHGHSDLMAQLVDLERHHRVAQRSSADLTS